MKKSRFYIGGFSFFIIGFILILNLVGAANSTDGGTPVSVSGSDTATGIDKGYKCLEDQVKNKSGLSLQEAIFTTLALGSKQNLQDKINSEKSSSDSCWPKSGCTIKETAQVLLAQKRAGKSIENIEKWLLSKNSTSSDLNWYLEVDISNHIAADCTLKYDGSEKTIKILDDMKITGNPGSCFSISRGGYWLLFRENCYDKEIQISCNQDFISAMVYEKKAGTTIYVLPDTHSSAALGSTSEKVSVKCFKSGTTCDYEGSLWAALALNKAGKNVDSFIPYLIAMAENNKKYFPSAFLYALTGAEDQYADIVQSQKQSRSWKMIGTPYGEYYDTSLAMLALTKTSAGELENTKNYLISIQGKDGCWDNDNIRNTAFLLYSGWPKVTVSVSDAGETLCESVAGQSCENSVSCLEAGGRVLSNFQCSGFSQCCSVKVALQSCSIKNGIICSSSQNCDGNIVQSAEGGCCVGACVNKPVENTCEIIGNSCRDSCLDGEEEDSTKTCSSGVCCTESTSTEPKSYAWLIITIIILIILVVLAIIFRNKLKIWWFKFKGKAKVSSITRPGVPPSSGQAHMPQPVYRPAPSSFSRPGQIRAMPRTVARKPISDKDKEMEETLKKLREMSK
ncbi:MAG: hypothetical protein AABX85_02605 [Nanoarchaeota archaeon]